MYDHSFDKQPCIYRPSIQIVIERQIHAGKNLERNAQKRGNNFRDSIDTTNTINRGIKFPNGFCTTSFFLQALRQSYQTEQRPGYFS